MMPRGNSGAGHRGQLFAAATFVALLSAPDAAFASFLSGDALDSMAMGIAWGVVIVLPVALIVLFWKLHVLPEKIAEARHHPQKDAIHVLCLLSLFVGGLLWPLAWLWAYTRPVTNVLAFGTDKHHDYFHEMEVRWRAGELDDEASAELLEELDEMARKARLPGSLGKMRREMAASLNNRPVAAADAAEKVSATPAVKGGSV